MFEKFSEFAERSATNVSRRQFLGRLGRGALAAAATVGGLLAFPDPAEAARKYCGTGSGPSCATKSVGDPCYLDNFVVGTCQGWGRTSCICRAK